MKKHFIPVFLLANFIVGSVCAQVVPPVDDQATNSPNLGGAASIEAPIITWQRSVGGTKTETFESMKQTSDGGVVLIGQSSSANGHVSGNKGGNDIWVVKLNSAGVIDWQKNIGGTLSDVGSDILQTSDGGYLVVGSTSSYNGDVTGSGYLGQIDAWVVKLNSSGSIEWKKCYGYYGYDRFLSVIQSTDGGYVFAGSSRSNFPELMNDYLGDHDAWVVKTDVNGVVQWQNVFGGSSYDLFTKITASPTGGFIATGYTSSPDYDVSQIYGNSDAWVVSISPWGSLDWEKTIGGSKGEEAHGLLVNTNEIIITGHSFSNTDDFMVNKGQTDLFAAKLSLSGDLIWSKTYGGNNSDFGKSICSFSNGYLILGSTSSTNGDVSANIGNNDVWMLKINTAGDLVWENSFGGSSSDAGKAVQIMPDGGFLIAGTSYSSNGNMTSNAGLSDYWIAKGSFLISTDTDQLNTAVESFNVTTAIRLYPNPAKDFINVDNNTTKNITAKLIDMQGKVVLETVINTGLNNLTLSSVSNGLYFLQYNGLTSKISVRK